MVHSHTAVRSVVLFVFLAVGLLPSSAWAASSPSLKLATAPGYLMGIEGHGWSHSRGVALTLWAGMWIVGVQLQPGARGYFEVGVKNLERCGDDTIDATDTSGRASSVRRIGPLCASSTSPPRPALTVLRGRVLQTSIHKILFPGGPSSISMTLGDRLYLWEPGTSDPAYDPHVDAGYLTLLDAYHVPARACSRVDCAEGFVWIWVAVRPGTTVLDLSPACLQARPPCERPDFGISIRIASLERIRA